VRAALGAGRTRLARQLLTESLLLGLAGGGLGVLAAVWGVSGLGRLLPAAAASLVELRVNGSVLAFTAALSLASAVLFGLAPALRAAGSDPQAALHESSRTLGPGRRGRRRGEALVVAEVALALTLLVGAGLLLRSFQQLQSVDAGFRPGGVLSLEVSLSPSRYGDGPAQARYFTDAVERLRRLPGVRAAGAVSVLPLSAPVIGGAGRSISTRGMATSFLVEGQPEPPRADWPTADVRAVTPGYFEALGIPLRRGRFLDERDGPRPAGEDPRRGGSGRIVVSEALARRAWPGADPIGQHLLVNMAGLTRGEVVGVVGDVRLASLDTEPRASIYWPATQLPGASMALVARTDGDPASLALTARAEIAALDPEQPIARLRPLDEVVAASLDQPRLGAGLLGLFAAVGVLLAALGIYGLLADRVAARRREFGVRMALGADRQRITLGVVRQGLKLTLLGTALGLVGGAALGRVMARLLFRLPPLDPWTFATVPLVLLGAAALASYLPARRAARMDPIAALRAE
ncbi:MAG TPA: FtsX-like permease family protein, partial [Vicinamibacteria bacterium]